jgi:hypothetical protein
LDKLANAFKGFATESFGKIIGPSLSCVDFKNINVSILNIRPKEMPLRKEILCLVGNDSLGCQEESAIVVFKHMAANG